MLIKKITATEIIDSRANPTVQAVVLLDDGAVFQASVPSGASTGTHEAHELRDRDPKRYQGLGVIQAVNFINTEINTALLGQNVTDQKKIDQILIDLDGTSNKKRLGANAILAVSMAVSRAGAYVNSLPLYEHLAQLAHREPRLPRPCFNVINGGVHAGNSLGYQEFMISPIANSCTEQIRIGSEIYHQIKLKLSEQYGGSATLLGDEGGFAPPINNAREALDLLDQVIKTTPYNGQVEYALDVAASEFFINNSYNPDFKQENDNFQTASELITEYQYLVDNYPIFSIEDPFEQNAFNDFALLKKSLAGKNVNVVGDDLTVTNTQRIQTAIDADSCDTLLLKINQIGTISESIDAFNLAKQNNWKVMVSHRSGETTDDYIADLATGLGAEYIKSGAPARGERTSKYNRLIKIEQEISS